VKSGHVTDTLTLQSPDPGTFKAVSDHHGGTKVVLVVPQAKPVAQATVSDKPVSDHQGDEHHTSLFADNFEFTYLAGFIDLDRSWTPGFHLGPEHHEASLDEGRHGTSAWNELTHIDSGYPAHMLAGHDFFL
jgi:hypothetical protein